MAATTPPSEAWPEHQGSRGAAERIILRAAKAAVAAAPEGPRAPLRRCGCEARFGKSQAGKYSVECFLLSPPGSAATHPSFHRLTTPSAGPRPPVPVPPRPGRQSGSQRGGVHQRGRPGRRYPALLPQRPPAFGPGGSEVRPAAGEQGRSERRTANARRGAREGASPRRKAPAQEAPAHEGRRGWRRLRRTALTEDGAEEEGRRGGEWRRGKSPQTTGYGGGLARACGCGKYGMLGNNRVASTSPVARG